MAILNVGGQTYKPKDGYLLVVRASWNDDVCKFLGWKTEFLEGWLDKVDVLVEHLVHVPAQLIHVSQDSLGQPTVSIRVNEQLHVEHITYLHNKNC